MVLSNLPAGYTEDDLRALITAHAGIFVLQCRTREKSTPVRCTAGLAITPNVTGAETLCRNLNGCMLDGSDTSVRARAWPLPSTSASASFTTQWERDDRAFPHLPAPTRLLADREFSVHDLFGDELLHIAASVPAVGGLPPRAPPRSHRQSTVSWRGLRPSDEVAALQAMPASLSGFSAYLRVPGARQVRMLHERAKESLPRQPCHSLWLQDYIRVSQLRTSLLSQHLQQRLADGSPDAGALAALLRQAGGDRSAATFAARHGGPATGYADTHAASQADAASVPGVASAPNDVAMGWVMDMVAVLLESAVPTSAALAQAVIRNTQAALGRLAPLSLRPSPRPPAAGSILTPVVVDRFSSLLGQLMATVPTPELRAQCADLHIAFATARGSLRDLLAVLQLLLPHVGGSEPASCHASPGPRRRSTQASPDTSKAFSPVRRDDAASVLPARRASSSAFSVE